MKSDDGWDIVSNDLNKVKTILTNPENLKMHLAADLDALCEIKPDASSLLEKIVPPGVQYSKKL